MLSTTVNEVRTPVHHWLVDGDSLHGADVDTALDRIETAARLAAIGVRSYGRAAISVEPGNGWSYKIILTDIASHAHMLGGDLAVFLPDWHKGLLLTTGGIYHVPSYIDEKLNLGDHSTIVAAFTTLLDAALTDLA